METASKTVAERWSRRKEKSTTGSQRFSRVKQQKESVWNASESLGASETTCWDEEGAGDAEDDMFDGSFADEDEEKVFNVARAPLNKALAAERSARRTVAQARAIMHDIKSSRGG